MQTFNSPRNLVQSPNSHTRQPINFSTNGNYGFFQPVPKLNINDMKKKLENISRQVDHFDQAGRPANPSQVLQSPPPVKKVPNLQLNFKLLSNAPSNPSSTQKTAQE